MISLFASIFLFRKNHFQICQNGLIFFEIWLIIFLRILFGSPSIDEESFNTYTRDLVEKIESKAQTKYQKKEKKSLKYIEE